MLPPICSNANYDAAVSSQVIGIMVQGIINAQSARRRPPLVAAPRVHCHYNQYGQYHCGSQ